MPRAEVIEIRGKRALVRDAGGHESLVPVCIGCGQPQVTCPNDCGARLAGCWER